MDAQNNTRKSKRPPGLLRASDTPDVIMMICTAGHVDHGKTRLVKLLTGCSTDRLKTEQERGLTIELGFAPCVLGGSVCVGIVDVPGHERFIRNMVAGVSGIALTVLVIAADDGVMPQTVEHVQIMELLGVRQGIVALTKTDLVAPERVDDTVGAVKNFLRGTFLEDAPVCPLSSETGEGLSEFYQTLIGSIEALQRVPAKGVFRMPVERSFAQKGFGTVVTGIPVAGRIAIGDKVAFVPGDRTGRVRGIQCFLRDAEQGRGGQCLALNISETGKSLPQRGDVVSLADTVQASTIFHLRLRTVPGLDPPLRHMENIKFHTGTSETAGTLYLLEDKQLTPGQEGWVTVVLTAPVAAATGDRFILRRPSPAATTAGGRIMATTHDTRRPKKKDALALLEVWRGLLGEGLLNGELNPERILQYHLLTARPLGSDVATLARECLFTEEEAQAALTTCVAQQSVCCLEERHYIHQEHFSATKDVLEKRLRNAQQNAESMWITLSDLQKGLDWPTPLWNVILAQALESFSLRLRGAKIMLRDMSQGLNEHDRCLCEKLLATYEETGFKSPRPDELPALLNAPEAAIQRLLDYLCEEAYLIRLTKNVILSVMVLRKAQTMAIETIQAEGQLDSAAFKNQIGSSRKYALAILDYLDARRITLRADNIRRLAANYKERLV